MWSFFVACYTANCFAQITLDGTEDADAEGAVEIDV